MSPPASPRARPPVRLRAVTVGDLRTLFEFQAEPAANAMALVRPRERLAFDRFWEGSLRNPAVRARAIVSDDVLVGSISCFPMAGLPSVGYWIGEPHWGRGVATAALALLLQEIQTRPLHARVARSNVGSVRVLERCGFRLTGYELASATERFLACEEATYKLNHGRASAP